MTAQKRLQRAFGIGALVLALGIGTAGCEGKVTNINRQESKRIELNVGDYEEIRDPDLVGQPMVEYHGMNNEKTFAISFCSREAVNNYYPADSKEIKLWRYKFNVIEVTPEHIILDYLGKTTEK